jgi:quercetin dioxygenase-like cupin family protein
MRKARFVGVALATSLFMTGLPCLAVAEHPDTANESPAPPGVESLLRSRLESVEGTEIIVDRIVLAPNATLPMHWHPGEEISYVLEGSAVLRQEGKADITTNAGEMVMIPARQVHTANGVDEGSTVLVMRVHPEGEPQRVLV